MGNRFLGVFRISRKSKGFRSMERGIISDLSGSATCGSLESSFPSGLGFGSTSSLFGIYLRKIYVSFMSCFVEYETEAGAVCVSNSTTTFSWYSNGTVSREKVRYGPRPREVSNPKESSTHLVLWSKV